MPTIYDLGRKALMALDAETAHTATIWLLERGIHPRATEPDAPSLRTRVMGLDFPNPLGMAAGFDKDARVPDAVLAMGFGFAEVGTLTPKPQSGNPKPRLFRLAADRAVVNRLGFNNGGHAAALHRLQQRRPAGILGVNIGANKDAADRVADYVAGLEAFYDTASYLTVNISSPNTPGLRDLQAPAALDELLSRLMRARAALELAGRPRRPIVVKIAPDIAEADIAPVCDRLASHAVDAIAVSNTTLTRPSYLTDRQAREGGGLSGRPLFERSTIMLARVYRETGGRIPLIGIGGIDSGETALAKIEAGATLLQLYSGMVYEGPGLVGRIKRHLAEAARREGVPAISGLTGRKATEWAGKELP